MCACHSRRNLKQDDLGAVIEVVSSAVCENIFQPRRNNMTQPQTSFGLIARQPSALLPIAMSIAALAVVLGHVVLFGVAHQADEGPAAHLWQLLMAAQMPVLLFFAIKWLPRAPKQTIAVLALQTGAVLAALAPVFFLHL